MSVGLEDVLSIDGIQPRNIESLNGWKCTGVSTDSRTVRQGQMFFALRGESFDGHAFVRAAMAQGAACAVVDRSANLAELTTYPLFIVEDTTSALGILAHGYRKKFHIPFIAVAGSNGKTTTKDMISSVLKTQYDVLSTEGNLNNHIGVPMTLLRLEPNHEKAVIEIGTNHFGEIRYLCEILEPTHGIITNIGHEHMEFFKSLDGVAKAEGELFEAIAAGGTGYVNADDRHLAAQENMLKNKITYSFSKPGADIMGSILSADAQARTSFSVSSKGLPQFEVQLSVPGKHMAYNGLAAAAVGLSHGVEAGNIQQSLNKFTAVGKRMQIVNAAGITIINDSYNSNPDSVAAALESLSEMKSTGKKIVVLADMLELGTVAVDEHRNIGRIVKRYGFEYLLTFGDLAPEFNQAAKLPQGKHFTEKSKLSEYLLRLVSHGDIVLVKGSRGMKMEEVVNFLLTKLNQN